MRKIERVRKERAKVHGTITDCELQIFVDDDQPYLQLGTTGSKGRQSAGQINQTIQFDRAGMEQLRKFIDEALGSS